MKSLILERPFVFQYRHVSFDTVSLFNAYNLKNMTQHKVKVTTTYNCSLERAFKTPMLCDVAKVHTGYGIMPKVTHCTEDAQWGQAGFSKKVFVAKSISQKGGWASVDKVIERIENKYWKIEVSDFQSWMLGFFSICRRMAND